MKRRIGVIAMAVSLSPVLVLAQDAGTPVSFDGAFRTPPTEQAAKLQSATSAQLADLAQNSTDPNERLAALWRLGGKKDRKAYLGAITGALVGPKMDADPVVRGNAAIILANFKGDERASARQALAEALDTEPKPVAQIPILYAVARTGDGRYTDSLIAIALNKKEPVKVRAGAAIALRQCDKTKASVPYLIRVYEETAPIVNVDNHVLMDAAGYTLRRLAPTKGAPWMTPGQNIIDQIHERHPNIQVLEVLFGFLAGKFL